MRIASEKICAIVGEREKRGIKSEGKVRPRAKFKRLSKGGNDEIP